MNRVKSILIVEDDAALRRELARSLAAVGYLVFEAGTFREATEQMALKPALLILDLTLPDATGWDVAAWLESLTDPGADCADFRGHARRDALTAIPPGGLPAQAVRGGRVAGRGGGASRETDDRVWGVSAPRSCSPALVPGAGWRLQVHDDHPAARARAGPPHPRGHAGPHARRASADGGRFLAGRRAPAHLPGRGARRRQDLRDADRGAQHAAAGIDVVVGFVETYGRPQTAAQLDDLDIVPRKPVRYGGIVLEEMDTPAVIARRPRIALVDELAHTNAPGSAHEKRYEDVLDLLHAGIDVWTTLNVQHIESLHTAVETITGIAVRETVPDWVVDQADEVALIDISVDEMHRRMNEGAIYPPAQARMALQNFFRKGNLTALREMALRRTAETVDEALERYMVEHRIAAPWAATERIMVAVDDRPFSKDLIRRAWHLARRLQAPLLAVHVEDPTRPLSAVDTASLQTNLELAEDLNVEIIRVPDRDVAAALARVAQDRRITQIVLGTRLRGRWQEFRQPTTARRLLGLVSQDLHLVRAPRADRPPGRPPQP